MLVITRRRKASILSTLPLGREIRPEAALRPEKSLGWIPSLMDFQPAGLVTAL
jgi:hypothetical protein